MFQRGRPLNRGESRTCAKSQGAPGAGSRHPMSVVCLMAPSASDDTSKLPNGVTNVSVRGAHR